MHDQTHQRKVFFYPFIKHLPLEVKDKEEKKVNGNNHFFKHSKKKFYYLHGHSPVPKIFCYCFSPKGVKGLAKVRLATLSLAERLLAFSSISSSLG